MTWDAELRVSAVCGLISAVIVAACFASDSGGRAGGGVPAGTGYSPRHKEWPTEPSQTDVGAKPFDSPPAPPSELSALHDDLEPLADSLLSWAAARGIPVAVVSVYRTREQQADLYRNRASNPYPVAPPGFSKHETGRAFDLASPDLERLGEHWERLGGTWGGRFRDPVHFEG